MVISFAHFLAQLIIAMFLLRLVEMYFPNSPVSKALAFLDG